MVLLNGFIIISTIIDHLMLFPIIFTIISALRNNCMSSISFTKTNIVSHPEPRILMHNKVLCDFSTRLRSKEQFVFHGPIKTSKTWSIPYFLSALQLYSLINLLHRLLTLRAYVPIHFSTFVALFFNDI